MSKYWIKIIYGPAGAGYPQDIIHFAEGQLNLAEKFSDGERFFLYETGHNGGNKTVYGHGIIKSHTVKTDLQPRKANGKEFPYGVEVKILHRVHPSNGIPLSMIRRILGITNIQRRGGIISLNKDKYNELLEKYTSLYDA